MFKEIGKLELKIGERIYHFICEKDSPLGEIHDVLCQMKGFVISKMNEILEAEKPKEEIKNEQSSQ